MCVSFVIDAFTTQMLGYLLLTKFNYEFISKLTTKLSRFEGNATFVEHAIILSKSLKYLLSCCQWSFLENISDKLDCLNNLEIILIAKRLVFNTIVIMPKAQTTKFYGSIATAPVNVSEMCK